MSHVRFVVRERGNLSGATEVVPVVDGQELTDLIHAFEKGVDMESRDVSYGGLIPANFRFGPLHRHFLAGEGAFVNEEGKVPLLGCECGEWGCWPLLASITVDEDGVVWCNFEQPYRPERDYSGFGPFRFDRAVYERALEDLERGVTSD